MSKPQKGSRQSVVTKQTVTNRFASEYSVRFSKLWMQFMSLRKYRTTKFVFIWLVSFFVLASFFLNTILKSATYLELFPSELVLPTILYGINALVIALIVFWLPWLKTMWGKCIVAIILSLFMVGYDANLNAASGLIRAFTPGLTDVDPLYIVSVIYFILLVVVSVLIGKGAEVLLARNKKLKATDILLGLVVLVLFLFIPPLLTATSIIATALSQSKVEADAFAPSGNKIPVEKPDIYYIVLDRYANNDVLQKQFSYDNAPFTEFLRNNGYVVKDEAYSNYPYTAISVASTMSADYTAKYVERFRDDKIQSRTLYQNLVRQSSVVKALKKEGYKYYSVGSWYGMTNKAPLAERDYFLHDRLEVFGLEKRMRGIEAVEFTKGPFYRLAQVNAGWWPIKYTSLKHEELVREQLHSLDEIVTKEEPGGRLVFAHILVPHEPFVFNADGSISSSPGLDYTVRPLKQKYINQVEFINTQMQELLRNIQEKSAGKAVVILNSDEGPYPQYMNGTFLKPTNPTADSEHDMSKWSDDWLQMKFGILQAVHIPRATEEDLANLSSVNVFRTVLNRYAGHELDYLPQCHYGLADGSGKEFVYADITKRFVANPDKKCSQWQSLPDK